MTRNSSPDRRAGYASRRWAIAGLGLLATIAYAALARRGDSARPTAAIAHQGIPITAVRAKRGDFEIRLAALGTVTAFNTVTVTSRVAGQIMRVAFKEGQMVREGDLLAQIDPRPYQVQLLQAEGQLAKDRASLANARITYERDGQLFAQGVIARQDLDNAYSQLRQYEGSLVSDRASVDNARLELTYARITAPISGKIGLRLVDPGNIIPATNTTSIAVITQLQPISVVFSIPEDDLHEVLGDRKADPQLPVDVYDRSLTRKLATGSLLALDSQIDQTTGTVRLKAVFPNKDGALFPNQFVNVKLQVGLQRNVVLVPAAAIQRSMQGTFVYVIKPTTAADSRAVKVSLIQGESAAIASGIEAGDLVVIDGVDKLRPGAHVQVELVANRAGGGADQQ